MSEASEPSAKVLFRVPEDDGSTNVETLWAKDLGNDHYELDNLPFYAYSVSLGDVVLAPFSDEEQFPTFQRVIKKSGNRTIRVIFEIPAQTGNSSGGVLKGLVSLGCEYEGATRSYYCINIPPEVDLEKVQDYLMDRDATWENADPET